MSTDGRYLTVRNWEKLQHYKHRNPPWIKLHSRILTDYEFACLQDASKLHLLLIWVLASQTDNQVPADPEYLQKTLGLEEKPDLKLLVDKGFLIDASNVLAECEQDASKTLALVEKRREEKKTIKSHQIDQFARFWQGYPKKVGKKKAAVAFSNLSAENQTAAVADIEAGRFSGANPKFIPHPTTYLHGERWNDELVQSASTDDSRLDWRYDV